jgi:hypothetical protein
MSALNPNNLSKFKGLVYFRDAGSTGGWTRLASVRGLIANLDATSKKVEVKADDTGTVLVGFTPDTSIEFELLENADRDLVAKLFGGTTVDVAASPVSVTAEAHGTGWTVGKPIKLNNKDGDGTIVASIVVKAGVTTLAAGTDYNTYVGDGTNGDLGYTYIVPVTVQTLAITADYSYTPNATEKSVITHSFSEAPNLEIKIEAVDPAAPTKYRRITISSAVFDGTFGMQFLDAVTAGDLTGASMVFRANEGSTLTYENEVL